jgi:DNA-binding response OmpR family regulator
MATVLIVEDDVDIRTIWAAVLTAAGHTVNSASDGVQAIKQMGLYRHDIILLDLMLPRLNGVEAIKVIRRTGPDLPILVITATQTGELAGQTREAGVKHVMSKPVDIDDLVLKVNELTQP